MIGKSVYFLRAPEDMKSPAEAAMFVVGSFMIYGFLASLPFFFFFTQMRSLAIGFFLAFLAMLAAEVFGTRRHIYSLKRFQIMGARWILLPFVAATAWQFWGLLRGINGELETLALANVLSIISLSCLLHALRKQSMKPDEK
jgi:hypothetical protein